MTDPVQSIRIAAVLAERLGVLMRSKSTGVGEAARGELELRIGEAQQIYPEIWRHLGDARAALAAKGRDVAAFDALRAEQGAQTAVLGIDSSHYVGMVGGVVGGIEAKSATFNLAGHARAEAACRALMAAMPEVDFAALARADAEQIALAGELQPRRWIAIFSWAASIALGLLLIAAVILLVTHRWSRSSEYALDHENPTIDMTEILNAPPPPPKRPSCGWSDRVEHRLVQTLGLYHDDDWSSHCAGGLFGHPGKLEEGLVLAVTARVASGEIRTVRGIAVEYGDRDLVVFAAAPDAIDALAVADLDRDGSDEIVFQTAHGIVVSRVRDGKFADLAGPPVIDPAHQRGPCSGTLAPTENGVELVVDASARGKDCPSPGRHALALDGDRVVVR
ncbi:MAG TPA: hypothetical protein VMJ10_29915 [Kofleriaceae bacterium]|nr:hypothetical protein [Kofleriaceae bacterium]